MEYKEYGSKNNDIIILLHGGGLSWWNYIDEISLLENEFHIVIPILDGHSGSDTNFTSIESNALEIINFINKNHNGKVKLIGGLSLGGQILLEILFIFCVGSTIISFSILHTEISTCDDISV